MGDCTLSRETGDMAKNRFEVCVWVYTRGWRKVGSYGSAAKALARARDFLPLEVRIDAPDGDKYWAGNAVIGLRYGPIENDMMGAFADRYGVSEGTTEDKVKEIDAGY